MELSEGMLAALNYILIFLIAIYIMQGFYRGFLVSVGNMVGMIVSWVVGFLFSPLLSHSISESSFYRVLVNLTEGSARLADQAQGNLVVASLSPSQIDSIITRSQANLPYPFADMIKTNMQNLAFSDSTVADLGPQSTVNNYFDFTVANVVVNIFSFLIIYCIARVIIALVINAVNFASPLPVLKHFDSTIGAGVGFVRGYFGMFALMMLVPVLLIAMPEGVDIFQNILDNSSIATYFYENNFLLGYISGLI